MLTIQSNATATCPCMHSCSNNNNSNMIVSVYYNAFASRRFGPPLLSYCDSIFHPLSPPVVRFFTDPCGLWVRGGWREERAGRTKTRRPQEVRCHPQRFERFLCAPRALRALPPRSQCFFQRPRRTLCSPLCSLKALQAKSERPYHERE